MDVQKIAEAIRSAVISELREEFREFRAEVRGQIEGFTKTLDGFRISIESMNSRMANIENDVRALNLRIDETNKRIDAVREELTARIDETNKRIDALSARLEQNTRELGNLKVEIVELKTRQEIIDDVVRRLGKLEEKVFA